MSPWLKIDDRTYDHPAILAAGDAAAGAWLRLATYCARHLTDGKIPAGAARMITTPAITDRLVSVGLLAHDGDGYRLDGDLAHVRNADEVEAERAAWRARQDKARTQKQSRKRSQRDLTRDSRCDSDGPDPDPDPVPDPKKKRPQAAGSPLPFSVTDLQRALDGAPNVALGGFSKALAKNLTEAIRSSGATADDLPTVRAYLEAGALGWMMQPMGWGYVASGNHLADLVAAAKSWNDDGRPTVGKNGGNGNGGRGASCWDRVHIAPEPQLPSAEEVLRKKGLGHLIEDVAAKRELP